MRHYKLESANTLECLLSPSSIRVRQHTVEMRDEVRCRVMTAIVVQLRESGSSCDRP
jgi:hypothetical protein